MSYIPALRYESLTRFYDPVLRATLKEDRFKRLLVEQSALRPGYRVLDVGCGTATLTILLKQACAEAEVTGLDGDAKVLDLGRAKIKTPLRQRSCPPGPPREAADRLSA
jgi:ubiquinone/menaquinone biosynthesis C-methylase UbiE